MKADFSTRHGIRGSAVRFAVGVGILATLAGVYAFRSLSARPGEGALRLVPADALLVGTIDLSPSASQTIAFKKIDDALERNGMKGLGEGSILGLIENEAAGVDELSKLVLRNGAFAALPGPKGTMDDAKAVGFLALSDGPAAQTILVKHGVPMFYKGLRYYKLKNGKSAMMVVGDLLVLAQDGAGLAQIHSVQTGATPAIATNARFETARSYVADDANVMLFMAPAVLTDMGPKAVAAGVTADWLSMGLAVRDGGIGFSCSGVIDPKKDPAVAKLGQITPIRADLFKILPAGAYGAFVESQPSNFYEALTPSLEKDKDTMKSIKQAEDSLQKQVGLDVDKDLIPALKGDFVIALYPASSASAAGLDALMVIDDSNGAAPSDAVDRFSSWVKRQSEKEGDQQGPLWTERRANGADFFRITDKLQGDMRKSMGQGMDDAQVNRTALVGNKTVAWAYVGKAVLASTSQDLLDRAVESFKAETGGLDTDPKFSASESKLLDGSQTLAMFSLSRIAEGVKNTIHDSKMSPDNRKMFDSCVAAFAGLDQPLTIHGHLQPDGRTSGGAFIPLDYDRLLDLAGDSTKKAKK